MESEADSPPPDPPAAVIVPPEQPQGLQYYIIILLLELPLALSRRVVAAIAPCMEQFLAA